MYCLKNNCSKAAGHSYENNLKITCKLEISLLKKTMKTPEKNKDADPTTRKRLYLKQHQHNALPYTQTFFNSNPIVLKYSVTRFRTTWDFIAGTACPTKSYLLAVVIVISTVLVRLKTFYIYQVISPNYK